MPEEMTNQTDEQIIATPEEVSNDPAIDETVVPEIDDDGNPIIPDETEPVDETEEVEWEDGKKYKIPSALKDALMMHKDYTQKTQDVAAQRKALDTAALQLREQAEFQQANIADYAKLHAIEDRLSEYAKIDWASASQTDPIAAQQAFIEYQQLKDVKGQLQVTLQQKEQYRALETQQNTARQIEEGRAVLARDIKDWSPDKAAELSKFGQESFGFTAQEMSQVFDPRLVKVLHMAHIGSQMIKSSKQATSKPVTQAKPVPTIAAKSGGGANDMERMSTQEWMKARNEQVSKKRR